MPCLPYVPAWSTCPCANVPINLPMCQRCANFSIWRVIMSKAVPIFQLGVPKCVPIFQLLFVFWFLNFSIMLNICKFLEYLGNSRKFISRNKGFKFWKISQFYLQNFVMEKPYQPETFNFVFNGVRGINRTIIRLV